MLLIIDHHSIHLCCEFAYVSICVLPVTKLAAMRVICKSKYGIIHVVRYGILQYVNLVENP